MKKLIALAVMTGLLSFASLSMADDLAVGDPGTHSTKTTHHSRHHHKKHHKKHKTGEMKNKSPKPAEKTAEPSK